MLSSFAFNFKLRRYREAAGPGRVALPGAGDRLVYAVHDYSWFVTAAEAVSYEAWAAARIRAWGRLVGPSGAGPPVWVSEFGVNHWSLGRSEAVAAAVGVAAGAPGEVAEAGAAGVGEAAGTGAGTWAEAEALTGASTGAEAEAGAAAAGELLWDSATRRLTLRGEQEWWRW